MEPDPIENQKQENNFYSIINAAGLWSNIATILGVIILFVSSILFFGVSGLKNLSLGLIIFSIILLILAVVLSPKSVISFLIGRQGRYGTNALIITFVFFFIIILVNVLFYRLSQDGFLRQDVTATRVFTLSPQSIQILENINTTINATVFMVPDPSGTDARRKQVVDLLDEFTRISPNLSYNFVDPELKPGEAKKYEISQYPAIVFENISNGVKQPINCSATPGSQLCLNFSEQDFISALLISTGQEKKVVYVLTGHGEPSITTSVNNLQPSQDGFDYAIEGLEKDNYTVTPINLIQDNIIPDDAAALIISGPENDLSQSEYEIINKYIKSGGRILAMLDPESPQLFKKLFEDWGIILSSDSVADSVSHVGDELLTPLIQKANGQFYADESIPIAKDLDTVYFPGVSAINTMLPNFDLPNSLKPTTIIKTTPASWIETDVSNIALDDKDFFPGPFPVGVLMRTNITLDESVMSLERNPEAKMIILGDSDFIKNYHFNFNDNQDLFLNSVNWLTEDYDLISIRAKVMVSRELNLNKREKDFVKWSSWFFPPFIMLFIGIIVWWRRR